MTSAMTRGCRILDSGRCKRRQKTMIMPALGKLGQRHTALDLKRVGYLDDEDDDWVLGVVDGGISTLEDTALRSCPGGSAGRGGKLDRLGHNLGDGSHDDGP